VTEASFCCPHGPYVILINKDEGGSIIRIERSGDPPFAVELAVSDKFVGEDIRRGPETPPETRILDRAPDRER
jgi:hypothetical protein